MRLESNAEIPHWAGQSSSAFHQKNTRTYEIWPRQSVWSLSWTCPMSAVLGCTANAFPSLSHGEQSCHSKASAGQSGGTRAWPKLCALVLRATRPSALYGLDMILRKWLDDNILCKFQISSCIHICLKKSEHCFLTRSV